MPELHKLDPELLFALDAYEEAPPEVDAGVAVVLRFDPAPATDADPDADPDPGDVEEVLAALAGLGFDAHTVVGDQAVGVVPFAAIVALTDHPAVVSMSAGRAPQPDVLSAVPDVKARASSAATTGVGGDGLWYLDPATLGVSGTARGDGAGVIVAVIDTGIDYRHPMFLHPGTPPLSRILRIWDQGLAPASIGEGPPATLLTTDQTYGVEYGQAAIDAALAGGPDLAHHDHSGHGTHVAGIAAGGPVPSTFPKVLAGVAPRADLLVVKFIDTPPLVRYRTDRGFGAKVDYTVRTYDAILYCLRVAAAENRPVVVNMSWGDTAGPGDANDGESAWLDDLMRPQRPHEAPGTPRLRFPTGAILVKSAGNSGYGPSGQHAVVTIPASGKVTVPVELFDTRTRSHLEWREGSYQLFDGRLDVHAWLRPPKPTVPGAPVRFGLRAPRQTGAVPMFGPGTVSSWSVLPVPGRPPLIDSGNSGAVPIRMVHDALASVVDRRRRGSAWRHHLWWGIHPHVSGATANYYPGPYELLVEGPADTEIYLMCGRHTVAGGQQVGFRIPSPTTGGPPLPAGVDVTGRSTAVDAMGQYCLAVAAYDDAGGASTAAGHGSLAYFSSQGPLRDFSDPPNTSVGPLPKPDIAAPGVEIVSARSRFHGPTARPGGPWPLWLSDDRFTSKQGTSMAAPVVTGIVALMLGKNPQLSTDDVRNALKARAGKLPAVGGATHADLFGMGLVDALASHVATRVPGTTP